MKIRKEVPHISKFIPLSAVSAIALLWFTNTAFSQHHGGPLSVDVSCQVEGQASNDGMGVVCYAFGNFLLGDQLFWSWEGAHGSLLITSPPTAPLPTLQIIDCLEPGIATLIVHRGNEWVEDVVAVDCTTFDFNF